MICLDASVVGLLISPDEKSDEAIDRYEKARLKGQVFVAPHLLPFETASILNKKRIRKLLTAPEVLGVLRFYQGLKIRLLEPEGMLERCLALCETFGKDLTPYDASYLALAEKNNAVLWTADKHFHDLVAVSYSNIELF